MNKTNYRGSANTAKMVAEEIARRWGDDEARQYDPFTNCRTFKDWVGMGYRVKKGEKSIRSMTFVKVEDEAGKEVRSYPKTVHLFYIKQVEPVNA